MDLDVSTLQKIKDIVGEGRVLSDEPLANHTTFRVGGPARFFVKAPGDLEQTKRLLDFLTQEHIPFYVLGRGSNILASDGGYDGLIVDLSAELTDIKVQGTTVYAQAGVTLAALAHVALENGLGGLEFAAGIPGTVGGAVTMNAGAYGGDMSQVISEVTTYCTASGTGELKTYACEDMEFAYRHSIVERGQDIVLGATFQLFEKEREEIKSLMDELRAKRVEKQPLQYPSAGSTFKRPEGYFAGKLIQDAGLSGYTVGGAQVSTKHCGFVVNVDHATAEDVWNVCKHARAVVKDQFGVELEPEVRLLGAFSQIEE